MSNSKNGTVVQIHALSVAIHLMKEEPKQNLSHQSNSTYISRESGLQSLNESLQNGELPIKVRRMGEVSNLKRKWLN